MKQDSHLTTEQAFRKAADYCAIQERCLSEVFLKCKQWGIAVSQIGPIQKKLVADAFVNESRYAAAFVRGKFKNNKWGKIKIVAELMQHHIPNSIVTKALEEIDEIDYIEMIKQLAIKKQSQLGADLFENRSKTIRYLASKGFEIGMITKVLNEIKNSTDS